VLLLAREDVLRQRVSIWRSALFIGLWVTVRMRRKCLIRPKALCVSAGFVSIQKAPCFSCPVSVTMPLICIWGRKKPDWKNEIVYTNLARSYLALHNLEKKHPGILMRFCVSLRTDLDILTQQAEIAEQQKKTNRLKSGIGVFSNKRRIMKMFVRIFRVFWLNKNAIRKHWLLWKPIWAYQPTTKNCCCCARNCMKNGMVWCCSHAYQFVVRDFPDSREGYLGLGRNMYYTIK